MFVTFIFTHVESIWETWIQFSQNIAAYFQLRKHAAKSSEATYHENLFECKLDIVNIGQDHFLA
jgi:hypothetical protein